MSDIAAWLQILGAVLVVAGVTVWSIAAGLVVAGMALVLFGVAAEKAG